VLGCVGMAPIYVISLCDILRELPEPHGAQGATVWEISTLEAGPFVRKP
jgi:hypothetical protein